MAKFTPMEFFSEVHGKISGVSKYATKKLYETQFTQLIVKSSKEATESMKAHRLLFKQALASVKTKLADSEQKATLVAAFKAQKKYHSLRGYALAQELAALKAAQS